MQCPICPNNNGYIQTSYEHYNYFVCPDCGLRIIAKHYRAMLRVATNMIKTNSDCTYTQPHSDWKKN